MKKVLYFKDEVETLDSGNDPEVVAFPADRLIGIEKSSDTALDFYFDDMQNTTAKVGKITLTVATDDDTTMKTYMENLVNEIAYGKSSVIVVYDGVKDVGFGGAAALFSAAAMVTHGA
tara:strand:+ start:450 stop:803 length:354 start_codon:yes stop_codon:yes gene_type:complete